MSPRQLHPPTLRPTPPGLPELMCGLTHPLLDVTLMSLLILSSVIFWT